MKEKKKINRVRIVKTDSINYTFLEDVIPKTNDGQKENYTKKNTRLFVKKTLKDSKKAKSRYKSNSRSPKSQQNHSPVYE